MSRGALLIRSVQSTSVFWDQKRSFSGYLQESGQHFDSCRFCGEVKCSFWKLLLFLINLKSYLTGCCVICKTNKQVFSVALIVVDALCSGSHFIRVGFTPHGESGPILIFTSELQKQGRRLELILLHMWKWIGYDWDICEFQSKQRDGVCPGTVSRGIIENADHCFIRRGNNMMLIVSFCSTSLVPYRMYDEHTHAVWHDPTFPEHYNRPVSFSSRCTGSVFHTNQSTDQSEEQQFHTRNILPLDATHVPDIRYGPPLQVHVNIWIQRREQQRKQQRTLTLISSRSKKFSMMPFLFQMIGGRRVPWMAQVRTALRPTVTVETLIRWSSARLSCTTSVGKEGMEENDKNWGRMPTGQIRDEGNKRSIRNVTRLRKEGGKKAGREN